MMEVEEDISNQLSQDLYKNKSTNQINYMEAVQGCLEKKMIDMIEIVRTEEKVDSTLKVLLNFKLKNPTQYKQDWKMADFNQANILSVFTNNNQQENLLKARIIICCQRDKDAVQYFQKASNLALKYPEINKLLILKVSNKRKLCIEESRLEKYDEEIFCKYKRKVDTNGCKYYKEFSQLKETIRKQKGLFDQQRLVEEGRRKGFCPSFTQIELINMADIIICEHKNIFKEGDKQKDIYQFIPMSKAEDKSTFLFLDQSQFLYEDIQSYNTFNIEQQMVHQSVNKCLQLKQIIYQVELVKKDKVQEVLKNDYKKLLAKLEAQIVKNGDQGQNQEEKQPQNAGQKQQSQLKQGLPNFVKNPIALVEYLQNACQEINTLFETHFCKKKNELESTKKFNNAHHSNVPNFLVNDKILQDSQLSDLKNLYPMRIQLRLVLDELLSYMFNNIYKDLNDDFLYFFTHHFQQPESQLKLFFQDHPEYLKEAICFPILTCTPALIKNFSRRIFESASNYLLTSDCIIQRSEQHTTTILGLRNQNEKRVLVIPRFELEPQVKFNLMPLFITKWNDQSTFESTSSNLKIENSTLQLRNYVNIINRVQEFTPDGIVIYLPNIAVFMKFIHEKINDINPKRPVYFESPYCQRKTVEAFNFYKQQCDVGQGAFFFCVANGWASRNIEFSDHYGRALLILGYPIRKEFYQYLQDNKNHSIYGLERKEFYSLDTMTRVTQCIKSVYTHNTDYCTIIMADLKLREDSDYLPKWANQNLKGQDELTVDDLFQHILDYQKAMGRLYS